MRFKNVICASFCTECKCYSKSLQDRVWPCDASLADCVCVGFHSYHRLPAQQHFGLADVWSSPLGVVLGFWEELDLTAAHCVWRHVIMFTGRQRWRREGHTVIIPVIIIIITVGARWDSVHRGASQTQQIFRERVKKRRGPACVQACFCQEP